MQELALLERVDGGVELSDASELRAQPDPRCSGAIAVGELPQGLDRFAAFATSQVHPAAMCEQVGRGRRLLAASSPSTSTC